jgi:Arc/MetJ-type ribon-helix-helix transcriptional regulator
MVTTINISLPKKLKVAADALVAEGEYASFSDLARTAIRQTVLERKYKAMLEEAKREEALGLSTVINNKEELDAYLKQLGK